MGMPVVFANPAASRSHHISSLKITQLRLTYPTGGHLKTSKVKQTAAATNLGPGLGQSLCRRPGSE